MSATETRDPWAGVLRMPWEIGHDVMPLLAFPAEKQAELNELAEADDPPPKWKSYGLCEMPSRAFWEWHARRGRYPWEETSREGIPRRMREAVVIRDVGICGICATAIARDDAVHLDHIHPLARGGATTLANLQLAHATCNLRKGARV